MIANSKDKKRYIIKTSEIEEFSIPGQEGIYKSRLLIDKESVGSKRLSISHGTLKPGKKIELGMHPCPYDEVYYILSGKAVFYLEDERYEIEKDNVVFIPCGLKHGLKNTGSEDFEFLGIFPIQFKKDVNHIYDERKRIWGKSFKLINEE